MVELHADSIYEFSGVSQPEVSFELKANAVKTQAKGKRNILFKDGTKIEIEYPVYHMRGIPSFLPSTLPSFHTHSQQKFQCSKPTTL